MKRVFAFIVFMLVAVGAANAQDTMVEAVLHSAGTGTWVRERLLPFTVIFMPGRRVSMR